MLCLTFIPCTYPPDFVIEKGLYADYINYIPFLFAFFGSLALVGTPIMFIFEAFLYLNLKKESHFAC